MWSHDRVIQVDEIQAQKVQSGVARITLREIFFEGRKVQGFGTLWFFEEIAHLKWVFTIFELKLLSRTTHRAWEGFLRKIFGKYLCGGS